MCKLYGVTRACYYAWRTRGQSRRDQEDGVLCKVIQKIFKATRGTYGSPRIHDALQDKGFRIGKKRVERLMRNGGLKGRCATLYRRGNAYIESFFHSMKSEWIHGNNFADPQAVARQVRSYIPFYNNKRKHSALGYMTPLEYKLKSA